MNQDSDNPAALPERRRLRMLLGGFVAACILITLGLFLAEAVSEAREAARQSVCIGHMNQLTMALQNYHDVYGSFPPAYVADADGQPMHSWRVLILPFIDESDVYDQYDFSEPWNGPKNSRLADRISLDMFHCDSGPHVGSSPITDYVVIVGPDTAFPGGTSTKFDDMRDGPENTILLVEIGNSDIHWMEPRDLPADEMNFMVDDPMRPGISSPHPRGPAVVFADGITAYRLDSSLRPDTLRALITIAGGEDVSREELIRSDGRGGPRLAE